MAFVAAESLAEQIANHLAERIINGELLGAERLQEARIVSELEVSRGSVREALLILERRHLVTILPRRGAFVTELTDERIRGLYRLYGNLLEMLAEKLSWSGTPEHKARLDHLISRLGTSANEHDRPRFIEDNFELISIAAACAGNEYLKDALENLRPPLHRALMAIIQKTPDEMKATSIFIRSLIECSMSGQMERVSELVNVYCKRHSYLAIDAINPLSS